jgi:8-oxo-dGTP pyrophosphatase MutT (NUDIX family)
VTSAADLRPLLLSPEAAAALDAPGTKDAAVLVPLYLDSGALHAVFTKRRHDLKRHAGEISFPGGRQDLPDEDLRTTALREAEEEIGLAPADVELVGALEPVGTFVTNYNSRSTRSSASSNRATLGRPSRPRSKKCWNCRCRISGAASRANA